MITRKQLIAGMNNRQAVLKVLESGDKYTAEGIITELQKYDEYNPTINTTAVIKAIADLMTKDKVPIEKTSAGSKHKYYQLATRIKQVKLPTLAIGERFNRIEGHRIVAHQGGITFSQKVVDACFHLVQSKPGAQITPDMIADWYELSDEEAMVLFNNVAKAYEDQLRVHRSITLR